MLPNVTAAFAAYAVDRSIPNRNRLVELHLHLAAAQADYLHQRMYRFHQRDDLFSDGCLGLIRAVERFDSANAAGASFKTYSQKWIVGSILDNIRGRDWVTKYGREAQKAGTAVVPSVVSFDKVVLNDDGEPMLFVSLRADLSSSDPAANQQRRDTVAVLFAALTLREQAILTHCYLNDLSGREVGLLLGCPEKMVYYVRTKAVTYLKQAFAKRKGGLGELE